jgi:endo-1,4-beta-xylanase
VSEERVLTRRSALLGAASATAGLMSGALPGVAGAAASAAHRRPLWKTAWERGIVYGSSIATWQLDPTYSRLFAREAAIMWPEDDFLWYHVKASPRAPLDFSFAEQIVRFAERNGQLIIGAPGLVWDDGFGDGWANVDMFSFSERYARRLLFGTVGATVKRFKGRMDAWVVCNEVIGVDPAKDGLRTDFPWYQTIGPEYVAESFHLVHSLDPDALLVLNEFGFEAVNEFGDQPEDKQRAALHVVDKLLKHNVPVQAFGVQAHLLADKFAQRFRPRSFKWFLQELADRGLQVLITEMDVRDDGLPPDRRIRDKGVAEVYKRFLDTALDVPRVKTVISFGLSDRYTWLQEDFPRDDGAPRRPLAFDQNLRPKRAFWAIRDAFVEADHRRALWVPPRAHRV